MCIKYIKTWYWKYFACIIFSIFCLLSCLNTLKLCVCVKFYNLITFVNVCFTIFHVRCMYIYILYEYTFLYHSFCYRGPFEETSKLFMLCWYFLQGIIVPIFILYVPEIQFIFKMRHIFLNLKDHGFSAIFKSILLEEHNLLLKDFLINKKKKLIILKRNI